VKGALCEKKLKRNRKILKMMIKKGRQQKKHSRGSLMMWAQLNDFMIKSDALPLVHQESTATTAVTITE
jgi:hypothetical protein